MNLVQLRRPSTTFALPFRHREVDGKILITNTEGNFLVLSKEDFVRFAEGEVPKETELYRRLAERNFVRAELDARRMTERLRARKTFLHAGPNLHIAVVTLRCNETCVYCHASRADMTATHTDMSKETASKVVDLVFESTNPGVTKL